MPKTTWNRQDGRRAYSCSNCEQLYWTRVQANSARSKCCMCYYLSCPMNTVLLSTTVGSYSVRIGANWHFGSPPGWDPNYAKSKEGRFCNVMNQLPCVWDYLPSIDSIFKNGTFMKKCHAEIAELHKSYFNGQILIYWSNPTLMLVDCEVYAPQHSASAQYMPNHDADAHGPPYWRCLCCAPPPPKCHFPTATLL